MSHRKFDFRTAYIDLLINLLTGTVVLFILTTLLIAPITKNNEGIKKNADYVITMEWPENIDCDVDLWLRDPQNNIISYKSPENGLMYIERDDMGRRNDIHLLDGKDVIVDPDNKEYATLRGTIAGEYILNAHVYSCFDTVKGGAMMPGSSVNIPLVVEIIKINPSYYVVKRIELVMDKVWQEKTVIRFVMGEHKNIVTFKEGFVSIRVEKGAQ